MVATVAGIHLGLDTHANRPAANAVPDGSIYSCSTHSLIYKSNYAGNTWATWATLGGVASSVTFQGCRVANTAGTSIPNATLTAIPFAGAEKYDPSGWHDTVTNNTRITPTTAGYYGIGGTVTLASASTTGNRMIAVRMNGTTYIALDIRPGALFSNEQYISIATEYQFNGTTDYVELYYYQSTGGAVALSVNADYGAQFWLSLRGT